MRESKTFLGRCQRYVMISIQILFSSQQKRWLGARDVDEVNIVILRRTGANTAQRDNTKTSTTWRANSTR